MKRQWWSWLLISFALAGGLVSLLGTSQEKTYELHALGGQGGRTWTVCAQGCDFSSIQIAIDTADTGDRIWIKPGTYAEHLVIRRSVTLEGSGARETIIKGAQPDKPILFIPWGPAPTKIRLGNLALIESSSNRSEGFFCDPVLDVGQCPAGIEVGGPVQLSLSQVQLDKHWSGGIWVYGPARVHLLESRIGSANIASILLWHKDAELLVVRSEISAGYSRTMFGTPIRMGIQADYAHRVTVIDSTFTRSDQAMSIGDQAQVLVINSRFFQTGAGVGRGFSGDKVKAVIVDSEFIESGLSVTDESQITIVNSRFKKGGIGLGEQARAVIYGSEIVENDGSGVFLSESVQVYLEGNRIADNRDWGVSLNVPQCGWQFGTAAPQISGRDNEIPDKDQPNGNKKGALCPADYPWPPGFRKP